ncbi:hypothetical protein BH10ACI1_BH10ACI1_20550 [soil metagenome]
MKQCPECSATYNDDMAFCLNDGTSLAAPAEADIPATVMFNSQQLPPATQNEEPSPTVFSSTPQQSYQQPQQSYQQPQEFGQQQPQFGQPPPFNQQSWQTPAPQNNSKSIIGIIAAVGIIFILLVGVVGGLIIYKKSNSVNYYPNNSNSSSNTNSTSYDQDVRQIEKMENGFRRISFEDVTSKGFFPSANKTTAATYEDGAERVVSFVSAYDSPTEAEAAFEKSLDQAKRDGKTVTARKENYVYYNKNGSYSTLFWVKNKLYQSTCKNEQVLFRFVK